MMYYQLPDGEPTRNIKSLIPGVINPQNLSDEKLAAHGVARCEVVQPVIEWWQQRGERVIDTEVSPHVITWEVGSLTDETIRARAAARIDPVESDLSLPRIAELARVRVAADDDTPIAVRISGVTEWLDPASALAHAVTVMEAEQFAELVTWVRADTIADAEDAESAIAAASPPAEWVQPTGAHDAYALDWLVLHGGNLWRSMVAANVWEPGVSNWRNMTQPDTGYPAWVQPTGAGDAYQIGDRVTHNGQDWESTHDANVWEPGVFGWVAL